MKKNVGTADKVIRTLIAIIVAVLYFTHVINGVAAIVLLALAVIFLLTSLISFCPIYWAVGLNTGKKKAE